ncbi:MAG: hypothetical protein ACP5S8_06320 [Hydrogenobaculum sp.]
MEEKEVARYLVTAVTGPDLKDPRFSVVPLYSDGSVGEPILPFCKKVKEVGAVIGESRFFVIVEDNNKESIYRESEKLVEGLDAVYNVGMIRGESDVAVVKYKGSELIIDADGKRASKDYTRVHQIGYVKGKSPYVLFENNNVNILVDFQNHKKILEAPIIYPHGLPEGSSDYFVASLENPKSFVIYDKNCVPISGDVYKEVLFDGLLEGKGNRYIAKTDEGWALYELGKGRISDFYEGMKASGALYGKSNILIVKEMGMEYMVDYESGKKLSGNFDEIVPFGLTNGQSPFFIAKRDGYYAMYDKNGQQITNSYQLMAPFTTLREWQEQAPEVLKEALKALSMPFKIHDSDSVYIPVYVLAAKDDKQFLLSESGAVLLQTDGNVIQANVFSMPN